METPQVTSEDMAEYKAEVAEELEMATKNRIEALASLHLTFGQFKSQYEDAFNCMMKYTDGQVGSSHFISKLADLADAYPEYEKMMAIA